MRVSEMLKIMEVCLNENRDRSLAMKAAILLGTMEQVGMTPPAIPEMINCDPYEVTAYGAIPIKTKIVFINKWEPENE